MTNYPTDKFVALSKQFWVHGVQATILMGSYARGDAGQFSDVDLVRLVSSTASTPLPGTGSHLLNGLLVVVRDTTAEQMERCFSEPQTAVNCVAGVRTARPLSDPDGLFASIQARAHDFTWD
jgi:hypothetical protein